MKACVAKGSPDALSVLSVNFTPKHPPPRRRFDRRSRRSDEVFFARLHGATAVLTTLRKGAI